MSIRIPWFAKHDGGLGGWSRISGGLSCDTSDREDSGFIGPAEPAFRGTGPPHFPKKGPKKSKKKLELPRRTFTTRTLLLLSKKKYAPPLQTHTRTRTHYTRIRVITFGRTSRTFMGDDKNRYWLDPRSRNRGLEIWGFSLYWQIQNHKFFPRLLRIHFTGWPKWRLFFINR